MPNLPMMNILPPQSWDEFEELCFQLFKREWADPKIRRNGRKGQGQNGVDIYGICNNVFKGLQCKGKQIYQQKTLTIKEITDEVKLAINFKPPLKDFIILTTAPRDAKIQEFVRLESEKETKQGLFNIDVFFWEDIKDRLINYIDLVKLFYPSLVSQDTEKIEKIDETTQKLDTKTDMILEVVRKTPPLYSNIAHPGITDLKDDIDYAKQLLETYKPETAFDYLVKMKDKKWSIISDKAKFRILANMGSAKLQMNLFDEAAEFFIQSYDYKKNDEKALFNLALAYSLKKDVPKALSTIKLIFDKNPINIEAQTLYIHNEKLKIEEIIEKIPKDIINKPEILHEIGYRYYTEGNYIKAIEYFQLAINNDEENNPNILANFASCILEMINNPNIIKKNVNINKTLEKIIDLFNKAIVIIQNTEEIKYKYQWILNRGIAKKLSQDLNGAEEDMKTALFYNENDRFVKRNLSLLYFEQVQEKGIEFLKELVDTQKTIEDKLLLSDFYRLSQKYNDAEDLLKELINQDIDDELKSNAYRILETVYEDQGDDENANDINIKRLKINSKDILARIDSAIRSNKRNNDELAKTKLLEAIDYVDDDTPLYERQILVNALYNNKLYKEAIGIFENFVNVNEDSAHSRKLLNCYYKIKKWDKALEICKNIRKINKNDVYILNMETYIYEQLGDNNAACELFEKYLEEYDEPEVKLNLGLLYLRMNNDKALDSLLDDRINYDNFSLENRIQLAQLLSIRNRRDDLFNILYETRRKFCNNSEAHSAYVWLILQRGNKDPDLLKIDTTTDNTVVFLEKEKEKDYYILEINESADLSKKEINSKNPLYSKLINKKINDDIILVDSDFSKEIWIIKEIKSKFIHALHESMDILNKQFPEDKTFQKVNIIDNDVRKTLDLLTKDYDEREKSFNEIINYYKEGKITIGILSDFLKKNIIEIWSFLVNNDKIGILNNTGNKNEYSITNEVFSFKKNIVIDQISLNTLVNINVDKEAIIKLDKFIISQSLIDEINQYISEINAFEGQRGFTVFKNGDDYFRTDKTEEITKSQQTYLKRLLDFAKKYCHIIPLEPKVISEIKDYDKIKKLIGISSINSILLAKQSGALLYSDDLMLRKFAKTEYKVDGFWTQYYLQKLMFENIICAEKYNNYVISLSDMNYKHTSINAEIILQSFKNSSWDISESSIKLLSILNGTNSDLLPAIMVSVNFTYILWNQIILSNERRDSIFIMLLNNLVKNRDKQTVIPLFISALKNKFYLIPKSYEEIIKIINDWLRN